MKKRTFINSHRGFTLLELMMVVAIIGILSSVAIPVYKDYINKVRVAEAFSILRTCAKESLEFYATNGVHYNWDGRSLADCAGETNGSLFTSNFVVISFYNVLAWTYLEVKLKNDGSAVGNRLIALAFNPSQQVWYCVPYGSGYEYAYAGANNGMVPRKFLPPDCK